jgi:hypothetical protein
MGERGVSCGGGGGGGGRRALMSSDRRLENRVVNLSRPIMHVSASATGYGGKNTGVE